MVDGGEPVSLFLSGKVSQGSSVPLDRPPSFRRPMFAGLVRHRLIGFVGIVGHFPFAFGLSDSPNRAADLRTETSGRWTFSAMASRECDFASLISSLSSFIDHPPRLESLICSPSAGAPQGW